MKKFRGMLHGCRMQKRKVANTHKQNSTTNITECKYEYHCEACDTTYDIFECGRCKLDMSVCVCEDPELNHISRHVAKMCRRCFNDISKYDAKFCEMITGLQQIPEFLIFLRLVLSRLLSKSDTMEELSGTQRCSKSWSAFVEYMRACVEPPNGTDEEAGKTIVKRAQDALPVSSGIKCFLFGHHMPSVCKYKPWEMHGICDDGKSTNKHITQKDALLSEDEAKEKCSFKQVKPSTARKAKTMYAKQNSVVEVLDPTTSQWVLGLVTEVLKDDLCYHIQYVEPLDPKSEQFVECGRVRLLTLGKYVSMVMRDFGFTSRSSTTKPELAKFLGEAFDTDDFDPKSFLDQLHTLSHPCCLALMMTAIATGFDVGSNYNDTSHLWDVHSGVSNTEVMRLNYEHLANKDTIRAIDMLSLWYGILFLVPTFSSDVMSQFMHESLLRLVRDDKPLDTSCGKKTTAWSGVQQRITEDPLTFIEALKIKDVEGNPMSPTAYVNLGNTDLPYTHMMDLFSNANFFAELHTITRYHSARFTMTCHRKKRRCGPELKRLLVLLQSTETDPGDMIDTYQREIRKIKSRLSVVYELTECLHDQKPVPRDLLCRTIANLLDISASQVDGRLTNMPSIKQKRCDAKARLGKQSTVLNIRHMGGRNYQTNIFNKLGEHPDYHPKPEVKAKASEQEVAQVDMEQARLMQVSDDEDEDDYGDNYDDMSDGAEPGVWNSCTDEQYLAIMNQNIDSDSDDEPPKEGEDNHDNEPPKEGGDNHDDEPPKEGGDNHDNKPPEEGGDNHDDEPPKCDRLVHPNQLDDVADEVHLDFTPKKTPSLPKRPVYDTTMFDRDALRQAQCVGSVEEGSLDLNRHAHIAELQQKARAAQKRKEARKRLKQASPHVQQPTTGLNPFDSSSDESSSDEEEEDEQEKVKVVANPTKRKVAQVEETDQADQSNDSTDEKSLVPSTLDQDNAKRNKKDSTRVHKRKSDEVAKTDESPKTKAVSNSPNHSTKPSAKKASETKKPRKPSAKKASETKKPRKPSAKKAKKARKTKKPRKPSDKKVRKMTSAEIDHFFALLQASRS